MPQTLADIKDIFAEALGRPPGDRAAYLDAVGAGDAALRAEVAALLAAHDRAAGFLNAGPHHDETRVADATPLGSDPGAGPSARPLPAALGGYRVERLLGTGGMGAVYAARDEKLDRSVAIKTMRPEVAALPGAAARFLREARAAARVQHPNVVPVLHVGEDAGTPFIVMPLLEGEALDRLLAREPRLPLPVVLAVGAQVADGLAAAHAKGLVHRDIKPANVWLEGDPAAAEWGARVQRVKVLDFGLARPANDDTHLTGAGAVLGTPAYMSPEQARGEPVDPRTDLFSLGVLLYRLTTGAQPFAGASTVAVLTRLATEQPPAPAALDPLIPPALSDLIMRLLAKDRTARPGSAADVAAELRRIADSLCAAGSVAHPHSGTHPVVLDGATEVVPARARPRAGARIVAGLCALVAAGLCALVAAALVAVVVIKITGPDGKETTLEVPPGSKVTIDKNGITNVVLPKDDKTKEVKPADDRAAAAWVLSVGGKATVRTAQGPREIAAELPKEPFRLTHATVSYTPKVTDADLAQLAGCAELVYLDLNETAVSDAGLEHLKALTGLVELRVGKTNITDAGLVHLKGMTAMTRLTACNNAKVGGDGLKHLKGMTNLTHLNLNAAGVTNVGLGHVAELATLEQLNLCGDVPGIDLAPLKKLKNLGMLELIGQPVGDDDLKHLAGLKNLGRLDLRQCPNVTAAGVAALRQTLTKLDVAGFEPPAP